MKAPAPTPALTPAALDRSPRPPRRARGSGGTGGTNGTGGGGGRGGCGRVPRRGSLSRAALRWGRQ
eukprot:3784122-Pyramimonas_sp.AAC.1